MSSHPRCPTTRSASKDGRRWQYDPGHGDYSQERHEIFADLELEELLAAIRQAPPAT